MPLDMTQDRFDACLDELLKVEGGWSNNKHDRGGPTMRGVIQSVYDAWREREGLARQSVRNITEAEWRAIYRANYWKAVRADALPVGLDLAVFDFGVNSGPTRAVRYLQACLGIPQDGHMGTVTIDKANRADTRELIGKYMAARRKFFRGLSDYRHFGKGWENRSNIIEPTAIAMAANTSPAVLGVKVPQPLPDADEQSASQGRAVSEPKPVSNKIIGPAVAVGSGVAVKVTEHAISAPPAELTQTVTNIGLWQSLGMQVASFGKFVWGNPIEVGVIVALVAAVWFAPRVLPVIWGRQT